MPLINRLPGRRVEEAAPFHIVKGFPPPRDWPQGSSRSIHNRIVKRRHPDGQLEPTSFTFTLTEDAHGRGQQTCTWKLTFRGKDIGLEECAVSTDVAVAAALHVLNNGTAEAVARRISLARVDWT